MDSYLYDIIKGNSYELYVQGVFCQTPHPSLPLDGGGRGGGDFHPYVVPEPGMEVIEATNYQKFPIKKNALLL